MSQTLIRNAKPKPPRGEVWREGRERRADRKAHEDREMQAAKRRDEFRCRRPSCRFMHLEPTLDPCHMKHRGMGGNPSGDRTTRATVITLCRPHHGMYDHNDDLVIAPLTPEGFDGPCDWFERDEETGEMKHVATETRVGVSVERSRR